MPAAPPRPSGSVAAVGAFLLAGAVAVALIAALTVVLWRHLAEQEAVRGASARVG